MDDKMDVFIHSDAGCRFPISMSREVLICRTRVVVASSNLHFICTNSASAAGVQFLRWPYNLLDAISLKAMSIRTEEGTGDLCSAVNRVELATEEGKGSTPESLFYVLPYVGLRELLVLETVCRQLREAIRGDVLLWQQLRVDSSFNKKFKDVELARLANRAPGRLQSLDLVNCTKVSEEAVEAVVTSNPLLKKLCLPGCTKVSPESLLRMVQAQTAGRSPDAPGFTQLRIRGIYGITPETLAALHSMMPAAPPAGPRTPQFYRNGEPASAFEEGRRLDVEVCPRCATARMVYDCPRPTCRARREAPLRQCRGCYLCIARCEECGACIDGDDYEETFCLEVLCQACWTRMPKCAECNRAGCSRHVEGLVDGGDGGDEDGRAGRVGSFTCDACVARHKFDALLELLDGADP